MKNIEQQIQLTEGLLKSVIQQAPLGIVVVSNDPSEIIYTNHTARCLGNSRFLFVTGNSLHSCIQGCHFFYPDGQICLPGQLPPIRALIQGEKFQEQPLLVQWPDSSQQWLLMAATPIYEQERIVAAVWMFSDISGIMFQQSQLLESDRIKKSLLRFVAHDLRGTFNGLLFFSDLLSQGLGNKDDTAFGEYAGMIKLSVKRAYDMTSDMLKWALQDEGSFEAGYKRIALHQLTDSVIEELRIPAYIKKIEFHTEVSRDLYVYCNPAMIGSVLRNLLSNAVKFSYIGNSVDLFATEDGQQVWVEVRDYGTGMKQEEAERFNTMHVLPSQPGTNGEQGSGIGLLICKDFITRHHGLLQVHNNPEGGCSFVFSIPLKKT